MHIQALGSPSPHSAEPLTPATGTATPAPDAAATARAAEAAPQPSHAQLADAVKRINQSMPTSSSLEFSIDADSKQTIVKIVDQNTKEVLRQIPSTEAMEIAKSVEKMLGRLISATA